MGPKEEPVVLSEEYEDDTTKIIENPIIVENNNTEIIENEWSLTNLEVDPLETEILNDIEFELNNYPNHPRKTNTVGHGTAGQERDYKMQRTILLFGIISVSCLI